MTSAKPNWALALIFALLLTGLSWSSAEAEFSTGEIIRAVQRNVCFRTFWLGSDQFRLGHFVPITLWRDDRVAYTWSESMSIAPHIEKWADFFELNSRPGQLVAVDYKGFNVSEMAGTPIFQQARSHFTYGTTQELSIPLPSDCTPHYLPTTPLKTRMLHVIEATMAYQLRESDKIKVGSRVTLVIADFDTDYQQAFVFVPLTNEMWRMDLHDESDPFGDEALRRGVYFTGPIHNDAWIELLKKKMAKYKIVREVDIRNS